MRKTLHAFGYGFAILLALLGIYTLLAVAFMLFIP